MEIKLKIALLEQGMTQGKLAKAAGIGQAYLSMAINGKFNLDEVQKAKIAEVLGKPVVELFGDA